MEQPTVVCHVSDVTDDFQAGTLNLREWRMQEWTYRHDVARVDIAGVDNAGVVKSAIWVVIIGYFNNRFMDFNRLFVATLMGSLNT